MKTKDHWSLSDEEFEKQFQNFTLKPGMFSHEAHLRLAYIHIVKYGQEQAEKNMCEQILGYATSLGGPEKFNRTVTVAAVKMVSHFMGKTRAQNFQDLVLEFPRINTHFKELLGQHYGINIFTDPKAKNIYIEPDLQPFD